MRDAGKEVSHKRAISLWVFWCRKKVSFPSNFVRYIELYMVFLGDEPADYYLSDLFAILSTVIASKPSEKIHVQEGQFLNPL